jgi:nitrous oxide reductase accessory protein NosL
MKKVIFSAIIMAFVLGSCNQKNKEEAPTPMEASNDTVATTTDTTKIDSKSTSELYACPMHPEVQGKLNDECPKCGMKLTEPVEK